MPDPIQSTSPATPHTIDLEPIVITGKLRHDEDSAAFATPLGELALKCLSKLDGIALVAVSATRASPLVGVLGGLKAGLELGECLAESRNDDAAHASTERAIAGCRENGGTPTGTVANVMRCEVPEDAP